MGRKIIRRVRVRVSEEMELQFRVESPERNRQISRMRIIFVIRDDGGGGKEKVRSAGGRLFQTRGAYMDMALL